MAGDVLPAFALASPGELRDQLVAAVLGGAKTATTSLRVYYEGEGADPYPVTGDYVLIDSAGQGVAVVEVEEVHESTIGLVDERLARAEGEGYTSPAEWRAGHDGFWRSGLPELGDRAPALDGDTPIVVEWFAVVGGAEDPRVRAFNARSEQPDFRFT